MTIMKQKWSALPVSHAMEVPDRMPKARIFDPDFYRMETELLCHLSNYQVVIDGFVAGVPTENLLPVLRKGQSERAGTACRRDRDLSHSKWGTGTPWPTP
jgi:hypothetical protein